MTVRVKLETRGLMRANSTGRAWSEDDHDKSGDNLGRLPL